MLQKTAAEYFEPGTTPEGVIETQSKILDFFKDDRDDFYSKKFKLAVFLREVKWSSLEYGRDDTKSFTSLINNYLGTNNRISGQCLENARRALENISWLY